MDIGSAFTFMFDDENWIAKIAIGGGILFAAILLSPIIVGLALFLPVSGYMLETLKNVRDGRPVPLPEWSDFGSLFSKGFMLFVIYLVYNIPSIIFSCLAGGANVAVQEADSDMAGVLATAAICLNCVQIILGLLGNALVPAALIRYAQSDRLGSAFQFGEIFGFISSNVGDYIIAIILSWVAGFIAFFGVILCGIGILFTMFWSTLVAANLYGQLARRMGPAYDTM